MKHFLFATGIFLSASYPLLADENTSISTIDQIGNFSTATIDQTGFGSTLESTVTQTGESHAVSVNQDLDMGTARSLVLQEGFGQSAAVTQTGGPAPFPGAPLTELVSTISQDGSGNNASVTQDLVFGKMSSSVWQSGLNQIATVEQVGSNYDVNTSELVQEGEGNTAFVRQAGLMSQTTSKVVMSGSGNAVHVEQAPFFLTRRIVADSLIDIAGSSNSASVYQDGDNGSDASSILIAGADNTVHVFQNSQRFDDEQKGINLSIADVDGSANDVTVEQNISSFSVAPFPGLNESSIVVEGSFNQISVEQGMPVYNEYNGKSVSDIHTVGTGNSVVSAQN